MAAIPFAVQLYTVRDALTQDPRRTLDRVKAIGYDYVELAGHANLAPRELRTLLDATGLTAVSSHVPLAELKDDLDAAIAAATTIGYRYLVVPWLGGDMVPNGKSDWIAAAKFMDEAGAKIRKAGLQLCYHNHNHEFERIDGEFIFDILMQVAKPQNLAAEIDTYWVKYSGVDPVDVIRNYTGRCPLLHIKDMTPGDDPTFAEVGAGIIDWQPIFDAGKTAGAEWYIVEQDVCPGDPLESIRISVEFMKRQQI